MQIVSNGDNVFLDKSEKKKKKKKKKLINLSSALLPSVVKVTKIHLSKTYNILWIINRHEKLEIF